MLCQLTGRKLSISTLPVRLKEDPDAAIELAARIPAARLGGAIEVRLIVER
jgi:hypothetical protein